MVRAFSTGSSCTADPSLLKGFSVQVLIVSQSLGSLRGSETLVLGAAGGSKFSPLHVLAA